MRETLWLVMIVQFVIGLAEVLLGLRLVLKLLGARETAAFVRWIYQTSQPLLEPFIGMFPTPSVQGLFVLEFSTLFAIVAYSIGGYILIQLLSSMSGATRPSNHN